MQAQRAGIHTNTCIRHAHLHRGVSVSKRVPPLHATTAPRFLQLPNIADFSTLGADVDEEPPERFRDVKAVSYISRRRMDEAGFDPEAVDEEGLPLVYNEQRIAEYWAGRRAVLLSRWTSFASISAPWLTKLGAAYLRGTLEAEQQQLAREAVENLTRLGPTFVKLGQILSIRPDVLPPPVMGELAKLQDNIAPFDTSEARQVVEAELKCRISDVFSEFSEQPVAAASLAQVYRARLRDTGQEVAVKVQRPNALATISKDLYVLRRAVGVYEGVVRRFTAQKTDYQLLLSTFAEGLYTEMDFRNEALNALRMQELHRGSDFDTELVIPTPFLQYTTRRVLVMEWVTGVKLTRLQPEQLRKLSDIGQAAFLTQLLDFGFFHGDPHPGNLLVVTDGPDEGKIAVLDFGLVAEVPQRDREAILSAIIHLANRDWNALIEDLIKLEFLPPDADRGLILPILDRTLSPYLSGGGAKSMNFQALSQDLLKTTLEIPFSVPPYMSLLARSVATLEGIALIGDPGYQMITQAYPFVVRKVLRNSGSADAALLRDIIYDSYGNVKPTRLEALLNAALGYVADRADGFVDLDAVPVEGASLQDIAAFLMSPEAKDLRPLLLKEVVNGLDLWARDSLRRAYAGLPALVPRIPFLGPLPVPPPPPLWVPGIGFMPLGDLVEALAPPLSQQEEVYLQTLGQLTSSALGVSREPQPAQMLQLMLTPTAQMRELQSALSAASGAPQASQVIQEVAADVISQLSQRQAARLGVPPETLFPVLPLVMSTIQMR